MDGDSKNAVEYDFASDSSTDEDEADSPYTGFIYHRIHRPRGESGVSERDRRFDEACVKITENVMAMVTRRNCLAADAVRWTFRHDGEHRDVESLVRRVKETFRIYYRRSTDPIQTGLMLNIIRGDIFEFLDEFIQEYSLQPPVAEN